MKTVCDKCSRRKGCNNFDSSRGTACKDFGKKEKKKKMCYIPDFLDQWSEHNRQQEEELNKLPKCCECGEPIQSEELYEFNDELICPSCLITYHRKWVEDYCG